MKLERPIIYFDVETTGLDTETSRIVEIACIKINPDGTQETKETLINPEISIPIECTEVHGITDEMVKDKPTFKQVSVSMREWFKDCDLAGYNSDSYDVNLLSAEFERAGLEGINWNPNLFDVLKLYRQLYPNTLEAVYERLTNKTLENAHSAIADIEATKEIGAILMKQLPELQTVKEVDEFLQGDKKRVDIAGKLYKDEEGVVRWNFSKNKDQDVRLDNGFCQWFLKQSFSRDTKDKIKEILNS